MREGLLQHIQEINLWGRINNEKCSKKIVRHILIDVGFIVLVALPPVRQAGVSLVLFGVCLAIMTVLSMAKNLKEVKNGEQEQGESLVFVITVYPFIYERVNRYTFNFSNMLTLTVTYGKMFLDRKGCGRR